MNAERSARFIKAVALADVLQAAGAVPELIDETQWNLAAQVVGAQQGRDARPASEKTKALVVDMLRERASLAVGDPFVGLV